MWFPDGAMSTKTGVMLGVASTASALVIASSLLVVGWLFHDINSLHAEIMREMADFKARSPPPARPLTASLQVVANDAWHGMILMQGHEPSGLDAAANPRLQFASIFKREKRGYASGGGSYASPQCSEWPPRPPFTPACRLRPTGLELPVRAAGTDGTGEWAVGVPNDRRFQPGYPGDDGTVSAAFQPPQ